MFKDDILILINNIKILERSHEKGSERWYQWTKGMFDSLKKEISKWEKRLLRDDRTNK